MLDIKSILTGHSYNARRVVSRHAYPFPKLPILQKVACTKGDLRLHLVIVFIFIIIIAIQRLLGQLLSLFSDLLRHLLVPALGGSVEVADPGHFQLKLLVFVVVVCYVDDACRLLDAVEKG